MYVNGRLAAATSLAFILLLEPFGVLSALAKATPTQLEKIIVDSKILDSQARVRVILQDAEKVATAITQLNPKATDNDCKINAVLIAKALMDAQPNEFVRVRVVFLDPKDKRHSLRIIVREGDVKAFAARAINQETLLAELEIFRFPLVSNSGQLKTSNYAKEFAHMVVPGIYQNERAQLFGQIQLLKTQGVGIAPFLERFSDIEEKAKAGDQAGVVSGLRSLTEAINEQIEQSKNARMEKSLPRSRRVRRAHG